MWTGPLSTSPWSCSPEAAPWLASVPWASPPPARQLPLVARVYAELRSPGIAVGEAIRRAKAAAVAEQPSSREVIEGFHLFGDPALVLYPSGPAPR